MLGSQDFSALWINCVMLYLSVAGLSSYVDQKPTDELFRSFQRLLPNTVDDQVRLITSVVLR